MNGAILRFLPYPLSRLELGVATCRMLTRVRTVRLESLTYCRAGVICSQKAATNVLDLTAPALISKVGVGDYRANRYDCPGFYRNCNLGCSCEGRRGVIRGHSNDFVRTNAIDLLRIWTYNLLGRVDRQRGFVASHTYFSCRDATEMGVFPPADSVRVTDNILPDFPRSSYLRETLIRGKPSRLTRIAMWVGHFFVASKNDSFKGREHLGTGFHTISCLDESHFSISGLDREQILPFPPDSKHGRFRSLATKRGQVGRGD
jgi:hypothetical protein